MQELLIWSTGALVKQHRVSVVELVFVIKWVPYSQRKPNKFVAGLSDFDDDYD